VIRAILLVLSASSAAAALAGDKVFAAPDGGARSGLAAACRPGSVPAVIGGKRRCLRHGQRCRRRLDRQYHRYGFHCHTGRLRGDDWIALESRPLHLPELAPGTACPRSPGREVTPTFGTLYGDGPAYAALFQRGDDGVVHYGASTPEGGWYYAKVLWVVDPPHRQRTLIRGRQIDGLNTLRFGFGPIPSSELKISEWGASSDSEWGSEPSETRLRAPGCYAYQADGKGFSTVIVFEAAP
jgi:hypothetical protein